MRATTMFLPGERTATLAACSGDDLASRSRTQRASLRTIVNPANPSIRVAVAATCHRLRSFGHVLGAERIIKLRV